MDAVDRGRRRALALDGAGARWLEADVELAKRERVEVPVQVNGKLRGRVVASPEATEGELREMALADERVRPWIVGREIVKTVVVPGRLVNLVVR